MRENYRLFFHPAIGRTKDAESAKRKYFFFSGEKARKEKTYAIMMDKTVVLPKGMLLFVFLPLKGKQIKK
jgi:hypothetical protein